MADISDATTGGSKPICVLFAGDEAGVNE